MEYGTTLNAALGAEMSATYSVWRTTIVEPRVSKRGVRGLKLTLFDIGAFDWVKTAGEADLPLVGLVLGAMLLCNNFVTPCGKPRSGFLSCEGLAYQTVYALSDWYLIHQYVCAHLYWFSVVYHLLVGDD